MASSARPRPKQEEEGGSNSHRCGSMALLTVSFAQSGGQSRWGRVSTVEEQGSLRGTWSCRVPSRQTTASVILVAHLPRAE